MRALRLLRGSENDPEAMCELTLLYLEDRCRQKLKPDTVSKEVAHIRWAIRILNREIPPKLNLLLGHLQRGLRLQQATTPRRKALPMSRSVLKQLCALLLKQSDLPTAVVVRLAYEAAGRVGDVFRLTTESFLRHGPQGILILWGVTKTHRTTEARADHQQIIKHAGILRHLLIDRSVLSRTSPARVLRAVSSLKPSDKYILQWQGWNPAHQVRTSFTLHSLKRGRAAELWVMAASGDITISQLLHELKHKTLEAALAYAPIPALAAQAIARHNASH
jgi:hypothetical protein